MIPDDVPEVVRLAAALDASNRANLKAQQEVVDLRRKASGREAEWVRWMGFHEEKLRKEAARAEAAERRELALRVALWAAIKTHGEPCSEPCSALDEWRAALSETKGPADV